MTAVEQPQQPLPTATEDLAELLRATPPHQWSSLLNRLETQLGDQEQARDLFEPAEQQVQHEHHVTDLREQLRQAIRAAQVETHRAEHLVHQLRGDAVYDVDFAETSHGADMLAFLSEAGRALRAVAALNPARPF